MKKIISMVVLTSILINLSLFGLPCVKGINPIGPKVVYAAEGEMSESTKWIIVGLVLLYYFLKHPTPTPQPSPTVEGFESPAIAPFKMGEEVEVNKSYTIRNAWKITLDSYQLFEGGAIDFNFVVENIQNEVAGAVMGPGCLLDSQGNEYRNVYISKSGKREYIPNVPVEIKVSFFDLKENIEALILYLTVSLDIPTQDGHEEKELFFGPIK